MIYVQNIWEFCKMSSHKFVSHYTYERIFFCLEFRYLTILLFMHLSVFISFLKKCLHFLSFCSQLILETLIINRFEKKELILFVR